MDNLLNNFVDSVGNGTENIGNAIMAQLMPFFTLAIVFMVVWLASKIYSAYRANKLYKTVLETKKDIEAIKEKLNMTAPKTSDAVSTANNPLER